MSNSRCRRAETMQPRTLPRRATSASGRLASSCGVLIVGSHAGVPGQHCRKVSPIILIRQYRFATPKPLQTRPGPGVAEPFLSAAAWVGLPTRLDCPWLARHQPSLDRNLLTRSDLEQLVGVSQALAATLMREFSAGPSTRRSRAPRGSGAQSCEKSQNRDGHTSVREHGPISRPWYRASRRS